jgi:hypothetical protein
MAAPSGSSGTAFSADDLLSSLGLDMELPAPTAPSMDENNKEGGYYQSSGYSLRLD